MSQNLNPTPTNAFDTLGTGRGTTSAFLTVFEARAPTSNDVSYPIQKRWINTDNGLEYCLESFTNSTGILQANWLLLGVSDTVTLTGNSGGTVAANSSNNIYVLGDTTSIEVTGDPATHTLTISSGSTVATSYGGNAGFANPSGGVLNIVGSGGVSTVASGNTVTISASGTGILQTLTGNSGGAVSPTVGGTINVIGDTTTIEVVGNPGTNTLTLSTASHVATQYNTDDSAHAIPSSGVLIVAGGTGIHTTSSGHTVTITNTSSESITFDEDSGTATPSAGVINFSGGTGISTIGAGDTVTIATTASVPTIFVTNDGSAVPFANSLTVVGIDGVTTSGSGNIVTITGTGSGVQVVQQVFTTSGTYTPTAGMQYCQIEMLGGGGAGGGAPSTASNQVSVGSPGSAGEYASGLFSAVDIGVSQVISIGAGGTGVSGTTGSNGGATSVGSLISAFGGNGGQASSATTGSVAVVLPAGGTGGSGGSVRTPGQIPGIRSFASTIDSIVESASGSNSPYGSGGAGTGSPANGNNGLGYGSGGSGAGSGGGGPNQTGGNGASGLVIITEYIGTTAAGSLQFSGNTGTALPSANNINIIGGTNISTVASGSSVTINNSISYSTGTFTPVLQFGGASVGIVYSIQEGQYTKIGNVVYFSLNVGITSKGSSTGNATITGMPFAAGSTLSEYEFWGTIAGVGMTLPANTNIMVGSISPSTTVIEFFSTTPQGASALTNTIFVNNLSFSFSGMYFV